MTRSTPTKARLAKYRKAAADFAARQKQEQTNPAYVAKYLNWRNYYCNPYASDWTRTVAPNGNWLVDDLNSLGRDMGSYHDIVGSARHTGWYADNLQHALIVGHVIRLRTSKGTYYMAATACNDWDGVTIYTGDTVIVPRGSCHDDHVSAMRDVAIWADGEAEQEAEDAREIDAKYQAESRISDLRDDIVKTRRDALALLREMRPLRRRAKVQDSPHVCNALRAHIDALCRDIKTARREIARLSENYWLSVE